MIGLILALLLSGAPPRAVVETGATRAAVDSLPAAADAPARATASPDSAASPLPVTTLGEVRIDRGRALLDARRRLPTAWVSDLRTGVTTRALESLADVLVAAAGVRVVQYGGLGAFSTVSIRGAPPGQVSVYLDGVPLASAAHGVVNLADLPLAAVERVEVYRALSPLALGAATPGGAINLVTIAAPGIRRATVVHGAFDTWEGRVSFGGRRGPLAALLHAGYQGSAGDFAFFDNNGTGAESGDDGVSLRANNRFDAATALGTLELEPGAGLRVRLREDLFEKRQGVPGLGVSQALDTRLSFQRSITQLEVERIDQGLWPRASLAGALQRERSRFRDLGLELGVGRHDTDDHIGGESVSLALEWPRLPLGASIQVGGAVRGEHARLRDAADGQPDPPESRREVRGAHVGVQLRPLGDWLTLHAAGRRDRIQDRLRSLGVAGSTQRSDVTRTMDSPQLGVRIAPGRGLELRANWAEAERAPDFMELFGNQGSVLGNPKLVPEHGENRDFGVAWRGALPAGIHAEIEAAHFESRLRDLIVYSQNSASTVKALNISAARIRGEELSLRLRIPGGLAVGSAITWGSSVDQGRAPAWRGKWLPQRPERQASTRVDWMRGRLRAAADLQYLGRNALDRYNVRWAEGRTLAGAAISIDALHERLRFTLEGRNLGDRRAADVGGFPLPGRSVFFACHARLGAPPSIAP